MSQEFTSNFDNDEDISALQYARRSGIAKDYLKDPVRSLNNLCSLIFQGVPGGWDCCESLPCFDFGTEPKIEERLTLSKDAAKFLSSVSRPETQDHHQLALSNLLDSRLRKKMKIWEPILKTDHELDCWEFRRRDNFDVKVQDIKLPLELVNEERGEGLRWTKAEQEIGPLLMQSITNEKLAVTRETLAYLQNTLSNCWSLENSNQMWNFVGTYKRRKITEPITPPLMPLDFPNLYEPNPESEAYKLPLLSDVPDLTHSDLTHFEDNIFQKDALTPIRNMSSRDNKSYMEGTVRLKDIYPPLASSDNSSPPSVNPTRLKVADLKVETPLTPTIPFSSRRGLANLSELAPELSYPAASPFKHDEVESEFFEEAFGPSHKRITQVVEQEKLSSASALYKVEVPKMDFSVRIPPWQTLAGKSSRSILQMDLLRETFDGMEFDKWTNTGQITKSMNLVLFDINLAQKVIQERGFAEDSTWKGFVEIVGTVIGSTAAAWKRPGLLICDACDDDEDDIEPGNFSEEHLMDINTLLKKRKLQVEGGGATAGHIPTETNGLVRQEDVENGCILGGPFSAQDSVDNFMEIRGMKRPKLAASQFFPQAIMEAANGFVSQPTESTLLEKPTATVMTRKVDFPSPSFDIPNEPFMIVASREICSKRDILKTLERTLPTLTIVERDFSAYNTSTWQQGSVARSPVISSLALEADFIVSPRVGIVLTTIQKIRQQPPPGQKRKEGIRNRVDKVSLRYDTLLILVSEGNELEGSGLDTYGSEALADFIGFITALERNVIVKFVAGGDKILMQWLLSAIVEYKVHEELLERETYWELFLRRAGMNAFAAQVVVALMKPPEGVDASNPTKAGHFGLGGFVEMGREARIERFAGICGRRVIEMVSDVVEKSWEQ